MKKALNINLSNTIFTIDDDAYDKLKQYLSDIEDHFSSEDEKIEIMADIEARISEIFSSKITTQRQVITIDDVDEIIKILGSPDDFSDGTESTSKKTTYQQRPYRRMYRDMENRIAGGVCSGLGAYWGIDPVILRIIFVLAAIAGAGVGIILYILLWFILPEAHTTAQKLEMRGEAVTIENIKKTVKDEYENIKNSFKKSSKTGNK
jgi:phage shock protein PspC (stress-responsive transcriptional regulator)